MLLNVFFRVSETLHNLDTDLILGILGPHSINYLHKEKAKHGGLAFGYASVIPTIGQEPSGLAARLPMTLSE